MVAKMTKSAWDRGAKNALICGGVVLVFWISLSQLIAWIGGYTFAEVRGPAFGSLWLLMMAWFFVAWLCGRNAGGEVLIDCGPHPTRNLFFLNAAIFLVMGSAIGSSILKLGTYSPAIGVIAAGYFLILACGRLQIREKGIWQYWDLVPWSRIEEYRWSDDGTLMITVKGKFGLSGYGALPVPPERKDELDKIIQEKSGLQPAA